MKKKLVALSLVAGLALVACSNQTIRDLEGVPVREPDKAEVYVNIDTYPNVNRICIDGVAFATTTRDAQAAIFRVPEWDSSFCGVVAR